MKKHGVFVVVVLGVSRGVVARRRPVKASSGNQKAEEDGGAPPISPIVPEASPNDGGDSGPAQRCSPNIPNDYAADVGETRRRSRGLARPTSSSTTTERVPRGSSTRRTLATALKSAHDKCAKCTEPAGQLRADSVVHGPVLLHPQRSELHRARRRKHRGRQLRRGLQRRSPVHARCVRGLSRDGRELRHGFQIVPHERPRHRALQELRHGPRGRVQRRHRRRL